MRARKWRHVFAKFKINRLQYDDITLIIRHSYIIGEISLETIVKKEKRKNISEVDYS